MMEKNGNTFAPGDKVFPAGRDGLKLASATQPGEVSYVDVDAGLVAVDYPSGRVLSRPEELVRA